MMSFWMLLKEKLVQIVLLVFAVVTIEIFLMIYSFDSFIKIYIPVIIFGLYMVGFIYEYLIKKRYYDELQKTIDGLDEKYLITEIMKTSNFVEGKILNDILSQVDKSMHEQVNKYKYLQEDYKEFIELWIHEVKLPLATSKMIIENNKNKVTKSIEEELDSIENYIEQALFYARSSAVEKDYSIRKCNLKDIVSESIKKNKTSLIEEKGEINIHDLDNVVSTDSKWIVFILSQIIQNSVKYRNKKLLLNIEIYSEPKKDNTVLYIRDNGIGIKKGEISRVFDKGFTGTNGRLAGKKSTGIGLYLCKKLCEKLGVSINVMSTEGDGTLISLVFPNSSFVRLK
ncbi:MAG: sensor histidine kinase [bacterium]|nr:sensor histidine kinase [bacterium]